MWAWIHQSSGKFDFEELDELMDLARKNGLKVILNTILESVPYWLGRKYPDARYKTSDGKLISLEAHEHMQIGGWPGLCFDHPGVEEEGAKFLKALARRYRNHEALLAYDVWNEPDLKHCYPGDAIFCYCDNSLNKFKLWLKNKYGALNNLNRAWSRKYSSWKEVYPPSLLYSSYPDMIDWRRFGIFHLTEIAAWRANTIRKIDGIHPTATHPYASAYGGNLAIHLWDEWLLGKGVDILGLSSFPLWRENMNDPVLHFYNLEAIKDAAQGKTFWIDSNLLFQVCLPHSRWGLFFKRCDYLIPYFNNDIKKKCQIPAVRVRSREQG